MFSKPQKVDHLGAFDNNNQFTIYAYAPGVDNRTYNNAYTMLDQPNIRGPNGDEPTPMFAICSSADGRTNWKKV